MLRNCSNYNYNDLDGRNVISAKRDPNGKRTINYGHEILSGHESRFRSTNFVYCIPARRFYEWKLKDHWVQYKWQRFFSLHRSQLESFKRFDQTRQSRYCLVPQTFRKHPEQLNLWQTSASCRVKRPPDKKRIASRECHAPRDTLSLLSELPLVLFRPSRCSAQCLRYLTPAGSLLFQQ